MAVASRGFGQEQIRKRIPTDRCVQSPRRSGSRRLPSITPSFGSNPHGPQQWPCGFCFAGMRARYRNVLSEERASACQASSSVLTSTVCGPSWQITVARAASCRRRYRHPTRPLSRGSQQGVLDPRGAYGMTSFSHLPFPAVRRLQLCSRHRACCGVMSCGPSNGEPFGKTLSPMGANTSRQRPGHGQTVGLASGLNPRSNMICK
jgi:hypothetical protein